MLSRTVRSLLYMATLSVVGSILWGCPSPKSSQPEVSPSSTKPAAQGTQLAKFVDVAMQAGLQFRYDIPGKRPVNILQAMGGGAAFLDYDGDGNLDILLLSQKVALYKGDGKGHFTDVTTTVLPSLPTGYWMGVAVGDYDNDGHDDVYLAQYRGGVLLHNEGGTRFQDMTKAAGIASQSWGSSCAFGDYDGDGNLDLYVGNYVDFGPKSVQLCNVKDFETSCSPTVYDAKKGVLYRNLGKGRFQDVTHLTKADTTTGKVLGVLFLDTDGSGRQSIVLPNDEVPSDLLLNTGKGFKNIGEVSGVAFTDSGKPFGGMGVDRGDIDGDGKPDIVIGTFTLENKLILINQGNNVFADQSESYGIAQLGRSYLTFGEKLFDYDNDSFLDLMMVNGYIADNVEKYEPNRTYREPTLLFHNEQGKSFSDMSKQAGDILQKPIVGRALAIGDYDNDGKLDALVVDAEGAPLLLHNETASAGNYLSLKLIGKTKTRNAYGAKVTAEANGQTHTYWCYADGSYLASSDPRVHIGLGKATSATITIFWPGGKTQKFTTDKLNRGLTITEGQNVE